MMKRLMSAALCLSMTLGTVFAATSIAAAADGGAPKDSGLLWLVNYNHSVSSAYETKDMRTVSGASVKLREMAASQIEKLVADMKKAGYAIQLNSGYRTYARQTYLFHTRLAQRQKNGMSAQEAYDDTKIYTAVPGTSEHQLGLAMDFSTDGTLSDAFAKTPQGKWLAANSWRYGYILRYETSKYGLTQIGNEPWHFRYVGIPHAQIMQEQGWCLEEYIAWLKQNKYISLTTGDMVYEIYRVDSAEVASSYRDIIDFSGDNDGGWIVTTYHAADPMKYVKGHWAERNFTKLFGEETQERFGVIHPDSAVTRGEFAALYALLLPETGGTSAFGDVAANHPYYKEIGAVASAGIMNGNQGKFRPEGLLTREEAAVAIAASVSESDLAYLDYSDVGTISGWAFQSVQKLAFHGIMNGADGKFRPWDTLTWAEAAALLCGLTDYEERMTDK